MSGSAANGIPSGTNQQSNEDRVLSTLRALNIRNFDTLADVALSGVKGEPIDDKTYLMERIIQLAADLPLDDRVSSTLTNNLLNQLWIDIEHPPKSYLGHEFVFRKPDGSNNNILWPHIGASGQPYARTVRAKQMQPPVRPDPGVGLPFILSTLKADS
jgi:linoleate 8R-lipoxygenase / 9,12-octadecadienoate 8-hydroperoxide 8R-isomerase